MSDTPSLFDLVGDAARLANRIDIIAADLYSDDPKAATAASAELEELINAQTDNREAIMAKADCWAWVVRRRRAIAQARANEATRLEILATADEADADDMEARLVAALTRSYPAETRFELPNHLITSYRSEAVDVTCDPATLPTDYKRVKVEVSADKKAIKAAIKAGTAVPGCELVQRRSWKLS